LIRGYNLATFDLEAIRNAALQKNIRYKGRKVSQDVTNLGYTLDDVSDCISALTTNDFKKTESYFESEAIFDVYIKNFQRKEQSPDRIYMKLRLLEGEVQVDLIEIGSFHL
jgi:hypothetical protein